jgi:hypothetical protein
LIRYLLDELQNYETGFSDALRPVQREATESFLGEHRQVRFATFKDLEDAIAIAHHSFGHTVKIQFKDEFNRFLTKLPPTPSNAPLPQQPLPHPSTLPTQVVRCGEVEGNTLRWRVNQVPSSVSQRIPESGQIAADQIPTDIQVPMLPKGTPMEEGWWIWVEDWKKPAPSRGNSVALCNWKKEWYSGPNRSAMGVLYGQRRKVALEFIDK